MERGAARARVPCGTYANPDLAAYCELDQLLALGFLDAWGVPERHPEVMRWMAAMRTLPKHDDVRVVMNEVVAKAKPTVTAALAEM